MRFFLKIIPLFFLFLIPSAYADVEFSNVDVCGLGILTDFFPFFEVCGSFPSTGSGITPDFGGNVEPVPTIQETIVLSVFGDSQSVEFGQVLTDKAIKIAYTGNDDLILETITPQVSPFLLVFQQAPLIVPSSPDIETINNLLYSAQIPEKACQDVQFDDCVFPIVYEVPVVMSFTQNGEIFQRTAVIVFDLTPKFDWLPFFTIFIAIIPIIIAFAIGRRRKKHEKVPHLVDGHRKPKEKIAESLANAGGSRQKLVVEQRYQEKKSRDFSKILRRGNKNQIKINVDNRVKSDNKPNIFRSLRSGRNEKSKVNIESKHGSGKAKNILKSLKSGRSKGRKLFIKD